MKPAVPGAVMPPSSGVAERSRYKGTLSERLGPGIADDGERGVPLVEAVEEPAPLERVQGIVDDRGHRPIILLSQPGDPLHDPDAPDLLQVARVAFDRMLYLLADLTQTPDEALPDRIAALGGQVDVRDAGGHRDGSGTVVEVTLPLAKTADDRRQAEEVGGR